MWISPLLILWCANNMQQHTSSSGCTTSHQLVTSSSNCYRLACAPLHNNHECPRTSAKSNPPKRHLIKVASVGHCQCPHACGGSSGRSRRCTSAVHDCSMQPAASEARPKPRLMLPNTVGGCWPLLLPAASAADAWRSVSSSPCTIPSHMPTQGPAAAHVQSAGSSTTGVATNQEPS
jgi:hypothetical protein